MHVGMDTDKVVDTDKDMDTDNDMDVAVDMDAHDPNLYRNERSEASRATTRWFLQSHTKSVEAQYRGAASVPPPIALVPDRA